MMQALRQATLDLRIRMTASSRERQLMKLSSRGQSPMSVLFYHRVADSHPNPWTVSCREFQRHVDYCREHTEIISLDELQSRSQAGFNDRLTSSFTFDDGYAENCRFAIPLLMRLQIPCTYFVTLENIQTGKPFAHDVHRGRALPINSIDELRAMADGGIEIGLHTRTHFNFSRPVTDKQIRSEIIDAAGELADLLRRPVRYFAFPFGLPQHLVPAAIQAVRDAGLQGYCSAYGAYNFPGDDPYHIRRIHGDPEFSRFRNWMTFDARKAKADLQPATPTRTSSPTQRPLRTMFVITSMPVGGAETLLVNLMDRFDPKRIEPAVVCLKEPGQLGEEISPRHEVLSHVLGSKWDLTVLPRLSKMMKDWRADAVITVGAGDKMFWGRLAAWQAGVPVVCSALHSTGWPDGVGRLNRMLTRITDGFIAVADHHGVHLSKHEGFPIDRVHIIRNGIDCNRFVPDDASRLALRHELRIGENAKLVGIVAALRPEKNHAMFVDVAKQVCEARDDVHFVIVGDGPQRGVVETLISEFHLQDRVHLLGTRMDTSKIVAALDLFLLCSHNEASPVSILEALACCVPVVSTRVGSVAESVVEGKTGYLVDTDDRESMTRHVLALLNDQKQRESMGQAGRKLVLATGSLDSMVEGYSTLIEWIYQSKRGRFASPARMTKEVEYVAASSCDFQEVH